MADSVTDSDRSSRRDDFFSGPAETIWRGNSWKPTTHQRRSSHDLFHCFEICKINTRCIPTLFIFPDLQLYKTSGRVIRARHVVLLRSVEIKRTIPKGAIGSKDFKTKKIFVGGIPTNLQMFKKPMFYFNVPDEHMIMRDHATSRSRGFGFVTFETEEAVDDLLSKGNKIDFAGSQVEIQKAEPKKPNAPPPRRYSDSRPSYGAGFGYGASSYRTGGGGRSGGYGGYGSEFGGGGMGAYRGAPSLGYPGRYGGSSYGRGYDLGGGYGGVGDGYGGGSADGGYDACLGGGYGVVGGSGGSSYGSRGGYGGGSGSARYHPYGRLVGPV
ncbi:hypothetical protein MKW98_016268 [Papaver atlanticum]|uniref:RRM domain-containing protein n=1 Tax=Papaver atlanticum TaxID=357466 RepID=A0AAD4SI01_9MAGN|nr:hypothetical protein MKW98_016268 [Papaver atlanticum]